VNGIGAAVPGDDTTYIDACSRVLAPEAYHGPPRDESPGKPGALVAFEPALSPPANGVGHHLCIVPLAMLSYMPMCV
jgi:hypothetical protein